MIMWGQAYSKNQVGAFQISYLMCFWLCMEPKPSKQNFPFSFHII